MNCALLCHPWRGCKKSVPWLVFCPSWHMTSIRRFNDVMVTLKWHHNNVFAGWDRRNSQNKSVFLDIYESGTANVMNLILLTNFIHSYSYIFIHFHLYKILLQIKIISTRINLKINPINPVQNIRRYCISKLFWQ